MHSIFHDPITTSVLDARELARMMRGYAARVRLEGTTPRPGDEPDAVLLGKLYMIDDLAWHTSGKELSSAETTELRAAANELGRAVEVLTERMAAGTKTAGEADEIDLTDFENGGAQ